MAAAKAGYFSDIAALQRAYAMNGFADHFLTDSFSSGHVRTPRAKILEFYQGFFDKNMSSILNYVYTAIGDQLIAQLFADHPNVTGMGLTTGHDFCADNREAIVEIKQQVEQQIKDHSLRQDELKDLIVRYFGGAVSKVLHDDDNVGGLEVRSKKHPEGWKAFGDGKLDPAFQTYIIEAVEASKAEVVQAFNIGNDFKKNTSKTVLYEKIRPLVYPTSHIEDYIPETNPAKSTPQPEWRIDTTGWDTMPRQMQDKLTAVINKYLTDKVLDAMLASIPNHVEKEVSWSPNVYLRPRDAIRHVLNQFRHNPVEFLTSAALSPRDLDQAIDASAFCTTFRNTR
jgi:hypothetical protein